MNPEKIMDNLFQELDVAIKALSKAKTVEEKLVSRQPCNDAKSVVSYLHNQPGRIGYEEIHRDTHRRGS